MATDTAPIELPAGRRSYISPARDSPNVNDPNWIPVLNNVDLQKLSEYMEKEATPQSTPQTPAATYSPFPPRPSSPKQRPNLHHNYSKSSLAPETVVSELEAEPLPPRTSSPLPPRISSRQNAASPSPLAQDPSSQHLRITSGVPSSDGQETVTSDGAEASAAPSTIGTASLLEEQYYMLPDAPIAKEDIQPPQVMSGRSSVASNRTKSSMMPPTSKYNRKPVNSMASGRPPTIRSQPVTPHDSPRMSPEPISTAPLPSADPLPSPQIPFRGQHPPMPDVASRIQSVRSTSSDRRQKALRSNPSNVSLHSQARSRANSTSDEEGIAPKVPSVRHKPRKSTDSRGGVARSPRGTIYDAQTPTPAPTTPLPQLPPEARTRPTTPAPSTRPTTRDGHVTRQMQSIQPLQPIQPPQEAHIASHAAPIKTSDHTRMASFMTTTSQVIFRRFDDVHVKLLLCLQDEIAQLEQELMAMENGAPAVGDSPGQKMRVMRELRRVVAEYGELLAFLEEFSANKLVRSPIRKLVVDASQ